MVLCADMGSGIIYCRAVLAKVTEEGSRVMLAQCLSITELRRTSVDTVGIY
jgi:hypothetical protein